MCLVSLAARDGVPSQYEAALHENGLRDLGRTRYDGKDPMRLARVVEKARARYTDVVILLSTVQ